MGVRESEVCSPYRLPENLRSVRKLVDVKAVRRRGRLLLWPLGQARRLQSAGNLP